MFGSAESERPRLTNGEIISEEFQPMWTQSTNVTDRRSDRQTTCDRRTALCTKVHRAVKKNYVTTVFCGLCGDTLFAQWSEWLDGIWCTYVLFGTSMQRVISNELKRYKMSSTKLVHRVKTPRLHQLTSSQFWNINGYEEICLRSAKILNGIYDKNCLVYTCI